MAYNFRLPWFKINTLRSGQLMLKGDSTDTDYVLLTVKVEGQPAQTVPHSMGNLGTGTYPVELTIPNVIVHGYDTVMIQYSIINSSAGPSPAVTFLENAAADVFTAIEKADLAYASYLSGLSLTQLSPQEGGAFVGAQLATFYQLLAGVAYPEFELGVIIGALTGWFADDIWSTFCPKCDGPVAFGAYVFSAAQLHNMAPAPDSPYGIVDDNPGVTSAGGCGDNSDYQVYWMVEIPAPVITLGDPGSSTAPAAAPGSLGGLINSPVYVGGSKFTVSGQNFPEGFVVVSLNGSIAGTPNVPNGSFVLSLTVPGTPNPGGETVSVTATGGGLSAPPLSFTTSSSPK